MKNQFKIAGVVVGLLVAVVVAAGAVVAQPAPPTSWVGEPPTLWAKDAQQAVNLAGLYGSSSEVIASFNVTPKDLDAMGISYPEWANGVPASMHLVALGGSYAVPVLTKGEPAQAMAGDLTLMVIDEATGLPTVTIVTSGEETQALMQRVSAFHK